MGFFTQCNAQCHAFGFADRIQWRVGNLRKSLGKIFSNPAFSIRQRINRITITHRRNFLHSGGQHWIHQKLEAFLIVGVSDIARDSAQIALVTTSGSTRVFFGIGQFINVDLRLRQQRLVITCRRHSFERFFSFKDALLLMVVKQHAASLDPATFDHAFGREINLAGFRHHRQVNIGFGTAQRTQAQPVKTRANNFAITKDHGGRAVILFLVKREKFKHGAYLGRNTVIVFPSRRHHRHHSRYQIQIVLINPRIQGLIQPATVRLPVGPHNRAVFGHRHRGLGQTVLFICIQLAIMRHQAERLRHGWMRVGVG